MKKTPLPKVKTYAFDPSLPLDVKTTLLNGIIYKIPLENNLQARLTGEYIEVVNHISPLRNGTIAFDFNEYYYFEIPTLQFINHGTSGFLGLIFRPVKRSNWQMIMRGFDQRWKTLRRIALFEDRLELIISICQK